MHPQDRIDARLSSLYQKVESGEPIDHEQQQKLSALDVVEAGVHFTREAIERSQAADAEHEQANLAADRDLLE